MCQLTADEFAEKKCPSCNENKPIREFYKDASRKDGHTPRCKECHNKSVRRWQINNSEKFKEMKKNWKSTHKKERAEESMRWARDHREQAHERAKRTRENHPETSQIWRRNNKEKIRNYQLTRRARIAGNGGNLTVEEWNAILDFYGYKCLCCGRDDVKLTIDHVVPIFHGGTHTADNIQPLCGPCNSRKKDKHIDYRKEYYASPRD